jgi:hypothetical protein
MAGVVKQTRVCVTINCCQNLKVCQIMIPAIQQAKNESEVDAEEIGDIYAIDSPQDAEQFRILTMKIQVFRPI